MSSTAERDDPALWEKVKKRVTRSSKGGKAGQWSARKAQMAVAAYKAEGGGYKGKKKADNSLAQWQEEEWGTKSGEPSGETGERYLPKKARAHLSKEEYARTTAKKRRDSARGKQFSAQPEDIAKKTAKDRHGAKKSTGKKSTGKKSTGKTKAELYALAKKRGVPGRSRMSKAELEKALA